MGSTKQRPKEPQLLARAEHVRGVGTSEPHAVQAQVRKTCKCAGTRGDEAHEPTPVDEHAIVVDPVDVQLLWYDRELCCEDVMVCCHGVVDGADDVHGLVPQAERDAQAVDAVSSRVPSSQDAPCGLNHGGVGSRQGISRQQCTRGILLVIVVVVVVVSRVEVYNVQYDLGTEA